MRYRLRYGRWGRMRFLSHHDEAPVLERAARRGGLPLAYSQGFTPRPRISFGSGLPVGYSSDAELMDLVLTEDLDPEELVLRFNSGLPEGFAIHAAARLPAGMPSLGAVIGAASYRISCDAFWFAGALRDFLAMDSYEMAKPHKGGHKKDDLRKGLLDARVTPEGAEMTCVIRPRSVRPSDVVSAMAALGGHDEPLALITRTALLAGAGERLEPLDVKTQSPLARKVAS